MKDGTRVLIALILALAIGVAIATLGNARWVDATNVLVPIGTIWVNAIRMTIIPLVISLLITGVASATDIGSIGRLGGRTLIVSVALGAAIASLSMIVAPLVFQLLPHDLGGRPPLPPGAADAAGQLGASGPAPTLSAWLVSLIPPNPIAAAANGAIVPFIIFSLLVGLAIARSPADARERLVLFFAAVRDAMLMLVRWIIALAPIGVFALVLPLAARSGSSLVGLVGFYIVVYSIACILGALLLYPVVAIVGGVSIARFARAVLPAQLIAFSSSSSIAALPALVDGAERDLEIPNRVAGFVVPLAVSMVKVAAPISWTVGALFIARFYGVELHTRELAMLAFAGVFFSFAGPGIPRGAFLMLTPLFLAVGLPAEGIGILIAVDTIPDLFATVLNVTGDLAATVLVSAPAWRPK